MTELDPRVNAIRPDLADARLKGQVETRHFAEGRPGGIVDPVAPLRVGPRPDARLSTEALLGEPVTVFDADGEGWAWAQLDRDRYVGYVPAGALGPAPAAPTHRVRALRSLIFPAPDIKTPPAGWLTLGTRLTALETQGDFVRIARGFVHAGHLEPAAYREKDPVAVAERFLGTPYLWGGKTAFGIDCSGLVQVVLEAAGYAAPRDSDMQEQALGEALPGDPNQFPALRRGDFVFWKGHVGMMLDDTFLIHANAHHMAVASEPLFAAIERVHAKTGALPTSFRRVSAPLPPRP